MKGILLLAFGALTAGALGGCFGETTEEQPCVPNRTISCACPGLTLGVQTCNAEGTGYSECTSCPEPSSGGSGGTAGSGGSGGSPGGGGTGG